MEKLEQFFEGEQSWEEYSKLFGEHWTNSNLQRQLLQLCHERMDLAKVIDYHLGKQSLEWMKLKVPALDYLTPLECLNDEALTKRLKVCLMRFP